MGVFDTVANVATLGGHNRLQKANADYEQAFSHYKAVYQTAENLKTEINNQHNILGELTCEAFQVLKRLYRILGHAESDLSAWQERGVLHKPRLATSAARELLSTYHSVQSMASGAGVGTGVALGSWLWFQC